MKHERFVAVALSILLALSFASGTALSEEEELVRGAELLAPLKGELKQALMAGMQGGPLNAISVCKEQAPAIAASHSVEGVKIGRTSHRLRNPDNSAPDWVDPILKKYLGEESDRAPVVLSLENNQEGYIEPIVIAPLCLACHGKTLEPGVLAHINEEYPEDEATGFDVGDLRGVYWVEYSAAD
ncbi:MAG: DUF3365 domain-containing protein [Gammaproteobacteria bacterium]|nr:DUF3365 domain-containing protein [Gammaproteobacteria bacterium]MDH3417445.1 DUF3365 domain-containing protein [Gammaproteobacteria bacterium]